jgi:hypothetical protein
VRKLCLGQHATGRRVNCRWFPAPQPNIGNSSLDPQFPPAEAPCVAACPCVRRAASRTG